MTLTQILVQRLGPEQDFGAVSQTVLIRSVFPSVAQASMTTANGNEDSGEDSYGDSVGGGF